MKNFYIVAIGLLSPLFITAQTLETKLQPNNSRTCASTEQLLLENQDPAVADRRAQIKADVEQYILRQNNVSAQRAVITIPVVFHIIHDGDAVGTNENIADVYIMEQLAQMNDDFRKTNTDASMVPAQFQGVHADLEIEFCLAVRDPDGNATTGINRYDYGQATHTQSSLNTTVKPATIWDRDSYLNIWSANLSGGLLGYAQFPGGAANTDGVVNLWSSFGSLAVTNPNGGNYNAGRTSTHEVGHWLGLYHIWGDVNGAGCAGDDEVADTPDQTTDYGGCPTLGASSTTCGSQDMFMNYMDYVNDDCMHMFTAGQKLRTDATLAGARLPLQSSMGCVPINGFDLSATTASQEICSPTDATYTVNVNANGTYTGNVALTASGQPAGTTVTFSATPVAAPGSTTMTISNTAAAASGSYTITVSGTDGSDTQTTDVTLTVQSAAPSAITLSTPADAATNEPIPVNFSWMADASASSYDIDIATDGAFSNIVSSQSSLTATNYIESSLSAATTYYWRVRGVNLCGAGAWSSVWSFTTSSSICFIQEDFENGAPAGWSFSVTPTGGWFIGNAQLGGLYPNPGSGNWVWYDDDNHGDTGENNVATVTSPATTVDGYENITLAFDINHQTFITSGQTTLEITNGTDTYYWDGSAWTMTTTAWLTDDFSGSFNELIPAGLTGDISVSLVYDDETDWAWGMGIDNFSLCGDLIPLPSLTIVTALTPSGVVGASPIAFAITVSEVSGNAPSSGEIVVRLPKDDRLTFTYDNALTSVGFTTVNNPDWTYDGSNAAFHLFKSSAVIPAGGSSAVGIEAMYDPEGTAGTTTLSAIIAPGSGNDSGADNNIDVETLTYFPE